jgi:hypothetical protein
MSIGMSIEKKNFLRTLGFVREISIVEKCKCPLCADKVDIEEFRNEVFMKEFERSGLCQECQDMVFGYKVAW